MSILSHDSGRRASFFPVFFGGPRLLGFLGCLVRARTSARDISENRILYGANILRLFLVRGQNILKYPKMEYPKIGYLAAL